MKTAFRYRPPGFTQVVIDTLTGENRILRADILHDAGRSLNPALMLGISALLALSDAVASCGDTYPDLHAPATAEQVLKAIGRARG